MVTDNNNRTGDFKNSDLWWLASEKVILLIIEHDSCAMQQLTRTHAARFVIRLCLSAGLWNHAWAGIVVFFTSICVLIKKDWSIGNTVIKNLLLALFSIIKEGNNDRYPIAELEIKIVCLAEKFFVFQLKHLN